MVAATAVALGPLFCHAQVQLPIGFCRPPLNCPNYSRIDLLTATKGSCRC